MIERMIPARENPFDRLYPTRRLRELLARASECVAPGDDLQLRLKLLRSLVLEDVFGGYVLAYLGLTVADITDIT